MLHYLAVLKTVVSVHKPVHSIITLTLVTYSLTWQADRCTSLRMGFKALLNAKARPFPSLCSSLLCAYCSKKMPERVPTVLKTATCTVDYRSTTCMGTLTIRLRSIKSSLPFSLPLRHSRDKLFQALSRFSVLEATESWVGPGNEARIS